MILDMSHQTAEQEPKPQAQEETPEQRRIKAAEPRAAELADGKIDNPRKSAS